MATIRGDRSKRYHVKSVGKDLSGEDKFQLVEGIPDPIKPNDAGRDNKDGPPIIEGAGTAFWTAANVAGFVWVERGFKRYWEFNEARAAQIRAGEG